MRKMGLLAAIALMAGLLVIPTASASGYRYLPYTGYNYDEWNKPVSSSAGYYAVKSVLSDAGNETVWKKPVDLFIDGNGDFYLINSEPAQIIVMDRDFRLKNILSSVTMPDGSTASLITPQGVFVKEDKLYIADSGLQMVLICQADGTVLQTLTKPDSAIFPQESTFEPLKVLADPLDNTYVLVNGVYQGAVCFDKHGDFFSFFGSNTVVATEKVLMRRFWRLFMTEEQINNTSTITPVEYTNFDIDDEGFIYTCTATGTEDTNQLRRLNSLGINILPSGRFGDLEYNYYKGTTYKTEFVDVAVDDEGYLFGLDGTRERIFVYDQDGEEMFIFGGSGNQLGNFKTAVAIDEYNGSLYVLDNAKASITEFIPTEYGEAVFAATAAYEQGRYTEAEALWQNVLRYNANYSLAYVGIGKAQYYMGEYTGAMASFEKGRDREQESKTFIEWRKQQIRTYITPVLIVLLLCVMGLIVWRLIRKHRCKGGRKK